MSAKEKMDRMLHNTQPGAPEPLCARLQQGRLTLFGDAMELRREMFAELLSHCGEEASSVTSIEVPGSVKFIAAFAFSDFINLEEISLAEGVLGIGCHAFAKCAKLRRVGIPASVRKADGWAFCGSGMDEPVFMANGRVLVYCPCRWQREVYSVPEGVEEIGSYAFFLNDNLRQVNLPASLRRIRSKAFVHCSFTEITVPEHTVIDDDAFNFFQHELRIQHGPELGFPAQNREYYRITGKIFWPYPKRRAPEARYWKEPAFQALAAQCAQGRVKAMEQMGDFFQARAAQEPEEVFFQNAAIFWRVRAHRYGSEAMLLHLLDWSDVEIDQRLFQLGLSEKLCGELDGVILNALGFPFFQEDRSYHLSSPDAQGVMEVFSWESDDGPDSDGYGREEYYDWWYLTEHLALPEGVGYFHSYSRLDRDHAEKEFCALHNQVAALCGKSGK